MLQHFSTTELSKYDIFTLQNFWPFWKFDTVKYRNRSFFLDDPNNDSSPNPTNANAAIQVTYCLLSKILNAALLLLVQEKFYSSTVVVVHKAQ